MTDRVETYDISGSPRVDISSMAGDVIIKPGGANQVKIVLSGHSETVDNTVIEVTSDSVSVNSKADKRSRRFFARAMDIIITAPEGGFIRVASGSGDVRVRVATEEVEVNSGNGDVRVEKGSGDVRVKSGSGDVVVTGAERDAEVTSASGDVKIGHATDATVNTASGRVVLGRIDGSARVKSASGDVKVGEFRGSDLEVTTMSGDVILNLAPGRVVSARIKTLSGDFRNKIKPSSGEKTSRMTLDVKSFSGDVTLRSAK